MKPRPKPDPKSDKRASSSGPKRPPDGHDPKPATRRKLAEIGQDIAELRSALEKVARQHSSSRPTNRDRK